MNIRLALCAPAILLIASLSGHARDSTWSPDEESVWNAVQARWQAWEDDDYEAYLAAHHGTWHRWSLRSEGLEDLEDAETFWHASKGFEETVAFNLTPSAVQIYGDGQFAAVHYIADETVRLRKERVNREGRTLPVGHEARIPIRFSDFYVRENGKWLFIGGYRDGSCALFRGFGTLCRE